MTHDNLIERIVGDESRRDFMKKSAAAAVGVGAAASGTAAAQEGGEGTSTGTETGGDGGVQAANWTAVVSVSNFKPGARFSVVSRAIEWTPTFGGLSADTFADYDMRMIRYENTGETVPIYVAQGKAIGQFDGGLGFVADADDDPNQPQLFEMDREYTPLEGSSNYVTVNVTQVPEEDEDRLLEGGSWWQGDPSATGGSEEESDG